MTPRWDPTLTLHWPPTRWTNFARSLFCLRLAVHVSYVLLLTILPRTFLEPSLTSSLWTVHRYVLLLTLIAAPSIMAPDQAGLLTASLLREEALHR